MKKVFLILFIILSKTAFSQSVLDKYGKNDLVSATVVDKKMFSLLAKMDIKDKETQQYVDLIKKMEDLRAYTTWDKRISDDMKTESEKYVKSAGLTQLHTGSGGNPASGIYVKPFSGNNPYKQLLLYIDGKGREETVLMLLTGSFNLEEASILAQRLNLAGAEYLKNASGK